MNSKPPERHDNNSSNFHSLDVGLSHLKESVAENREMLQAIIDRLSVLHDQRRL